MFEMETVTKICIACHESKPIDCYYKHSQMGDGHLNKCKECVKYSTRKNRRLKIEYYREYDRKRGNRQSKDYRRQYREKYPNKYRAHNLVNNAIRAGKLFSEPCEVCGVTNTHAHHDDYAKPLNVRWLCPAHHKQWHEENGEGRNP